MYLFRTYATELDPTPKQRELCARHAGVARFVYNWGLNQNIEGQKRGEKYANNFALSVRLNKIKAKEFPWITEVSTHASREALRELHLAFESFFRRASLKKSGQLKGKVGFPGYRARKRCLSSFTFPTKVRVFEKHIKLPNIGHVRLKERGYIPVERTPGVRIISTTVKERAGRWFVHVHVEQEFPERTTEGGPIVGVDLGVKTLATISDGTRIENPKAFKQTAERLRRVNRQMSRRKRGGANWHKAALKAARLHLRAANIRKDVLHKTTTMLAKTKSVVVIEDLNVRGMGKFRNLSASIRDASFGEFRRMLRYKSVQYGSWLMVAPRFYPSSKTCHRCGFLLKKLDLSTREWTCPECGAHHDRDLNAAHNLVNWWTETWNTASSAEIDACGEESCMAGYDSGQVLLDEAGTGESLASAKANA